ncbi:MAG: winged helix-turn-helix domain-containing protein [Caulobacteraceae bacterium]
MLNMEQKPLVLIVDSDPGTHRFLGPALEANGYRVASATTVQEGLAAMVMRPPDAVILELAFPQYAGPDILGSALEAYAGQVIAITSPDGEHVRASAIAAGAFDLIEKPFAVADLIGRVRDALANRGAPAQGVRIKIGAVEIDLARRQIARDGVAVRLSSREYELLSLLALSRGRVVTHGQLVDALWPQPPCDGVQNLRVLVGALRQKIEANAASPQIILTIPGVGYRFAALADQSLSDARPRAEV